MSEKLKVALAHDYLNSWGGGERVLNLFKSYLYPDADVFTITHDEVKVEGHVTYPVKTSILQKIPGGKRYHKWFLALMPWAVVTMNFKGYDVVLSDSSGFIKGIKTSKNCLHVCYIHTTTRYLTVDQDYFKESVPKAIHWIMPPFLKYLQKKDLEGSMEPDIYIANSHETAKRVKKYYGRDVEAVVFPPVDEHTFFRNPDDKNGDFYLVAGRLAPYKRFDLAILACNELKKKLVVIGAGPEEEELKKIAGPTIEFRGKVSDDVLRTAYATCKAMIFPPLEDAGMTPLECMACGSPVIAYGKGGALESIIDGVTGVFFEQQTVKGLSDAILHFESVTLKTSDIIKRAENFKGTEFLRKIKNIIEEGLAQKAEKK